MTKTKQGKGRVQLLLIATVFLGPLVLAAWLYFAAQDLTPEGRTNNGVLLQPIVNLPDMLPGSPLHAHNDGHWVLLYTNTGGCDEACEYSLYTLRQSRLMLGKEMDRVKRVFLHGTESPDTLFIAEEHKGLITLRDADLRAVLDNKKPESLTGGGYYLIDPHGNLVMYFRPGINPREMVDDIKRLLKLSRIG